MDPRTARPAGPRRFEPGSFLLGAALATLLFSFTRPAAAIDLGAIAKSVTNLIRIKKDLDGDIKALTSDAKTLLADKESLLQIKEQLVRLSTETRAQIDSVSTLVGVVEGHLKATQADITKTATHVNQIDDVRKALEGK